MKNILSLLFFVSTFARCQVVDSSKCFSTVGDAAINTCKQVDIDTAFNGTWVTNCLSFHPTDYNIHFGFIIVNGNCGPITPYNLLYLNVWDANCDSIVASAQIQAPNWDFHLLIDSTKDYILCYTWKPRCEHYSFCPQITTSALPVEFGYFKAEFHGEFVKLLWNTLSENNNNYFVVEKSYADDAYLDFCGIGVVRGNGTSTVEHRYQYIDRIESSERIYYRIRQVDYNGDFDYSQPICVNPETGDSSFFYFNILGIPYGTNYDLLPKNNLYIKVSHTSKNLIYK